MMMQVPAIHISPSNTDFRSLSLARAHGGRRRLRYYSRSLLRAKIIDSAGKRACHFPLYSTVITGANCIIRLINSSRDRGGVRRAADSRSLFRVDNTYDSLFIFQEYTQASASGGAKRVTEANALAGSFVFRICRTRISTGTRPASSATGAECPWWTNSSAARWTRSIAAIATTPNLPAVAMDAARSSVLVRNTCYIASISLEIVTALGREYAYACKRSSARTGAKQ